jgi:hypothetical protein
MPAASCKPVGLLATLTKSPTLNVADEVFTSNVGDQRLATSGLSTPPDSIASPLHCVVRRFP